MLAIPLDKLTALLDELEKNVVGAQLRWRQLRRLIDQEAAQQSVQRTFLWPVWAWSLYIILSAVFIVIAVVFGIR